MMTAPALCRATRCQCLLLSDPSGRRNDRRSSDGVKRPVGLYSRPFRCIDNVSPTAPPIAIAPLRVSSSGFKQTVLAVKTSVVARSHGYPCLTSRDQDLD